MVFYKYIFCCPIDFRIVAWPKNRFHVRAFSGKLCTSSNNAVTGILVSKKEMKSVLREDANEKAFAKTDNCCAILLQ